MQSYYLNRVHDLKCALMELSLEETVTGARIMDSGVKIQIEDCERYTDRQVIHNCELIFKGERDE